MKRLILGLALCLCWHCCGSQGPDNTQEMAIIRQSFSELINNGANLRPEDRDARFRAIRDALNHDRVECGFSGVLLEVVPLLLKKIQAGEPNEEVLNFILKMLSHLRGRICPINFEEPGPAEAHKDFFILSIWDSALSLPRKRWVAIMPPVYELVKFAMQIDVDQGLALSSYLYKHGFCALALKNYKPLAGADFLVPQFDLLRQLNEKQAEIDQNEINELQQW
jgi:hypothetical protein